VKRCWPISWRIRSPQEWRRRRANNSSALGNDCQNFFRSPNNQGRDNIFAAIAVVSGLFPLWQSTPPTGLISQFQADICSEGDRLLAGLRSAETASTIGFRGASMSFIVELWSFMRVRKKYWLAPIMFVMVIFGGLVVLTNGSVIAPMIYTLF
jgi:hypothetical protein